MSSLIAVLGHTRKPTCGVEDYCSFLRQALGQLGIELDAVHVEWAERSWVSALLQLWCQSANWRGHWAVLQYTAGAWSRYGFPFGALLVIAILRCRHVRCAVMFHEPYSWEVAATDSLDRVRAACQNWVIRALYHSVSKAIFADPLETITWLPKNPQKAVSIPIGSNIPEPASWGSIANRDGGITKTVAVFCLSDPPRQQVELYEISRAMRVASAKMSGLRLVLVGNGTAEAKEQVQQVFAGTGIEVQNLGIRSAEEVSRVLAESDAMLCVRGRLFPRRGSALAGIACGVPVIAYEGPAQRTPLAETGIEFVPYGDSDALGAALVQVLTDERLQAELRARNRWGRENYFSWKSIASRHLEALSIASVSTIPRQAYGPDLSATAASKDASLWLDALRGLAAIGVLTNHWRDCFFRDYSQLHVHNALVAVAYFITGLGHQWVIVFFVLSGYLVGGSVLRQVSKGEWSWREYALNRLTRLYIVLIPALLLGGLIDLIGLRFFGTSEVYTAHHGMRLMTVAPASHVSLQIMLGNYLFLQGILVPVFGTNGPLWSLSYEFWYYVAFPLLFFVLWKRSSSFGRLLNLFGFFAVLIFIRQKIALMGLIWLMGVAIHWLPRVQSSVRLKRRLELACVVAITIACLGWCKESHSPLSDYVLGAAVALLVYFTVYCAPSSPSGLLRNVIQYSAKSSYTLYLVHLPLLILFTAWIGEPRWQPTVTTLSYAGLILIAVLIYSWLVYLMFEKHTNALRRWLSSSLTRRAKRTVPAAEIVRAA